MSLCAASHRKKRNLHGFSLNLLEDASLLVASFFFFFWYCMNSNDDKGRNTEIGNLQSGVDLK